MQPQMSEQTPNFYAQVYAVVRRIPQGKVTSYGRIAHMLGRPNAARAVGYALNALKEQEDHDVPWQRVINSQGRISIVNREHGANEQAKLLRGEGVPVSDDLRVDMRLYLWGGLNLMELDGIIGKNG
ncbi:MAG: MGMT family protein [Anaerolinea sp.]|nr:MGMT family protein [Anaerolinea sp.]